MSETAATYRAGKQHKFHAQATEYRGEVYPSKLEAQVAADLDVLKSAGLITGWNRGTRWPLLDKPKRSYIPDFEVAFRLGAPTVLVEAKGIETPVWRLKKALFANRYPDVRLVVVKRGDSVRIALGLEAA